MANLEIVKELYRSFSSKDYESFLSICTPELEWIQNPGFPNGKRHRARGGQWTMSEVVNRKQILI